MYRLTAAALLFATSASAEMIIDDARLVAAFGSARAAAAYMEIKNEGESDALIGAYSDLAMTMLHETVESDGVMKMEMTERVEIPQYHVASLAPGGLHVMVMGLSPDVLGEETFPLTLIFETAGEITVDLPVQIGVDVDHGVEGVGLDHGEGETE